MASFSSPQSGLRSRALRNPALVQSETARAVNEQASASLFETLALSFVLTAVAGALPLVMYLRG